MRKGYFLVHRQFLTPESFKSPVKTLAWIDFISMANHEDAIVPASYSFLANRWGISKSTAHAWIESWIAERQIERLAERCPERNAERFFVVNYAKYQRSAERPAERTSERFAERTSEPMKVTTKNQLQELTTGIKTPKPPAGASTARYKHAELHTPLLDEFERWAGTTVKLRDHKRLKKLDDAIETFGREDLRHAWDQMSEDPYLMGTDPKAPKKYLTIDYALRPDRIEHWLNEYIRTH